MPDILIRNVERQTLMRLKRRAQRHGRSLQSEAKLLLEQAAGSDDVKAMLESWQGRLSGRQFGNSADLVHEDRER